MDPGPDTEPITVRLSPIHLADHREPITLRRIHVTKHVTVDRAEIVRARRREIRRFEGLGGKLRVSWPVGGEQVDGDGRKSRLGRALGARPGPARTKTRRASCEMRVELIPPRGP